MQEVRRAGDDELCGFVDEVDGGWSAYVVFGARLGAHDTRDDAVRQVLHDGLASLTDLWTLRDAAGSEQRVRIVEVSPDAVTVALGFYVLADVPRVTITAADLRAGVWMLTR